MHASVKEGRKVVSENTSCAIERGLFMSSSLKNCGSLAAAGRIESNRTRQVEYELELVYRAIN